MNSFGLFLASSAISMIPAPVRLTGQVRVHTDAEVYGIGGLKRKRVQPRGNRPCRCGRAISSNKNLCKSCSEAC